MQPVSHSKRDPVYSQRLFEKKKNRSDSLYTNELKLKLAFSIAPKFLFHNYQNMFIKNGSRHR